MKNFHNNPWGIITALFTHEDLTHLLGNVIGLFGIFILFIISNMHVSEDEIKMRIMNFNINIFFTSILVNFMWVLSHPNISVTGSSNIGYTALGVIYVYSIINCLNLYLLYH